MPGIYRCAHPMPANQPRSVCDVANTYTGPMDVWEAINSVRVIRDFADRPLSAEHDDRILNAARRTGSSKNEQAWAFIVVHDREHLQELTGVGKYADHLAGAATAVALVTPRERRVGAHVGPRPSGAEHGPRRLGAGDRERARDGPQQSGSLRSCSACRTRALQLPAVLRLPG